jgi:hypothetical protein
MDRNALFVLLLSSGCVEAYEPALAANNYAHELADCSAFYMLSAIIVKAQRPELADQLQKTGEFVYELSSTLTNPKLALARAEMATKTMMKEIDNDSINFSILLNKYAEPCKESVDNSEARMDYWLKKQD